MTQSALIIPMPQAEELVGDIREAYDPAAMFGVPAHISILYPFMAPDRIDHQTMERLRNIFMKFEPFEFQLGEVRRFAYTLYLSVEPEDVFISMTKALEAQFPDYPPYGGEHGEVVPHLTLAFRHRLRWRSIRKKVQERLSQGQGNSGYCDSVRLIDNSTGMWEDMEEILLGQPG